MKEWNAVSKDPSSLPCPGLLYPVYCLVLSAKIVFFLLLRSVVSPERVTYVRMCSCSSSHHHTTYRWFAGVSSCSLTLTSTGVSYFHQCLGCDLKPQFITPSFRNRNMRGHFHIYTMKTPSSKRIVSSAIHFILLYLTPIDPISFTSLDYRNPQSAFVVVEKFLIGFPTRQVRKPADVASPGTIFDNNDLKSLIPLPANDAS